MVNRAPNDERKFPFGRLFGGAALGGLFAYMQFFSSLEGGTTPGALRGYLIYFGIVAFLVGLIPILIAYIVIPLS